MPAEVHCHAAAQRSCARQVAPEAGKERAVLDDKLFSNRYYLDLIGWVGSPSFFSSFKHARRGSFLAIRMIPT